MPSVKYLTLVLCGLDKSSKRILYPTWTSSKMYQSKMLSERCARRNPQTYLISEDASHFFCYSCRDAGSRHSPGLCAGNNVILG